MAIKAVCCGTCIHNVQHIYLTHPIHPSIHQSTCKTRKIKYSGPQHIQPYIYLAIQNTQPPKTQPPTKQFFFCATNTLSVYLSFFFVFGCCCFNSQTVCCCYEYSDVVMSTSIQCLLLVLYCLCIGVCMCFCIQYIHTCSKVYIRELTVVVVRVYTTTTSTILENCIVVLVLSWR